MTSTHDNFFNLEESSLTPMTVFEVSGRPAIVEANRNNAINRIRSMADIVAEPDDDASSAALRLRLPFSSVFAERATDPMSGDIADDTNVDNGIGCGAMRNSREATAHMNPTKGLASSLAAAV